MQTLENIYTFHTRNFCVKVEALPEYDPDFSFDESGETQENVESGKWVCFAVRASVSFRGFRIGEDYLGNCIHENIRDFKDHSRRNRKGHGSYFSDMVRQSIKEAREHFNNLPKIRQ